ncbi:MAG TPA: HEAT repeat domain-containing protein [Gemmataceae bacterium]|nr:HEAT repeat domain-containing protein [Gemmataceae bacterium]
MAKARSSEAKLARLRQLRGASAASQLLQELRGFLGDASNFVVADAAELVGEARLTDLAPDLAAAYVRFLDNPVKKDKLCRAKIAIVDALNKLEFADEEFYLRGIRYVQREPAWGEPVDAAAPIRVACAFGLVRIRYRGVLALLVDLLTDPEKGVRAGAARALAYSGTEAAGLLLRLKARLGDAESEVVSECLSGIVELNPEQSVRFVAEFIATPPAEVQEAALLALASSRRPEAFEVLKSFAEKQRGELQEVAHLALALLRLPAATDYLLTLLADESQTAASTALAALAVHRHDPGVRQRVATVVAGRRDAALQSLFERRFGGDQADGDG